MKWEYAQDEVKMDMVAAALTSTEMSEKSKKDYRVSIKAQYIVDEYDILILATKDSNG